MNVPMVNLLPSHRVGALHTRRLVRRWCLWGGVYLGVMCLASGAYSLNTTREDIDSQEARIVRARLDAERSNKQALTARVADLTKRLQVAQAVGRHPDWSILIAFLSREAGTTVTIDRLELRQSRRARAEKNSKRPNAQDMMVYEVTLSGVAQNMSAINAYVGRIEASNAFDRVKLGETSASPSDAMGTATRFTLTGEIFDSDGGTP